jgi:hypothetical protein
MGKILSIHLFNLILFQSLLEELLYIWIAFYVYEGSFLISAKFHFCLICSNIFWKIHSTFKHHVWSSNSSGSCILWITSVFMEKNWCNATDPMPLFSWGLGPPIPDCCGSPAHYFSYIVFWRAWSASLFVCWQTTSLLLIFAWHCIYPKS